MKRKQLGTQTPDQPMPDGRPTVTETAEADPLDSIPRMAHTFTAPILCATVYLLLLVCRTVDFSRVVSDRSNMMLSLIALQLFVYMLPALLYIRFRRIDVRRGMRMRLFAPDKFPMVLAAALLLIFIENLLSSLDAFPVLSETAGITMEFSDSADMKEWLLAAVCFALLPAICEELLFRGILLAEYRRSGVMAAIVVSSLFFGMLHFDLSRLPFCFVSGVVLSLCTYATGSVFAAVTAHLCYNLFELFGGGIARGLFDTLSDRTLIVVVLTVMVLLCAALFFGEGQRLYAYYASRGEKEGFVRPLKGKNTVRFFLALFAPASLLCMVIFALAALLL